MKIIIDISEDDFIKAKEDSKTHLLDLMWDAVAHGTPLPTDKPKNGCCSCPHSGSIIDGYRDCPDAYTKQAQYCGFYNIGK
jgi:hypothetical protein